MTYRFEQFAATRRQLGNIALSPDGREVAYITDTSGQFNVWRQPVTGGWPSQLTLFEDWTARFLAWSPDGSRLAIMADKDGAERYQIFLLPVSGGVTEPLTDRMDVQYVFTKLAFSPDGSKLLYAGNELTPTENAIFVRDLTSGEVRVLAEDLGYAFGVSWSPDGRQVLVRQFNSNSDANLYLLDAETGERRLLTEHEGEVMYVSGPWLPDSSAFYVISDLGREFRGLALCHVPSGEFEWLETPDWDVESVSSSKDGRVLAWSVDEDGISVVHVRDRTTGSQRMISNLPAGALYDLAVSADGATAVAQIITATQCMELYTVQVERGTVDQITFGMLGGIPREGFVEPELIHYESFDGRRIPAFLYKPRSTAGGKIPVVLSIHGGPEAQERPVYSYAGLYQYLAYRGVAVLAPNVRGSTGYGKSYQRLIHRDWGGDDLRDFEHAARYLLDQEWVDADRIGVFGASYGGFATLSCVTRLPQYWAVAAEAVGPSNLITFGTTVPPTWRRFFEDWVGNPETEREFLLERSPVTYVDQIRCPLLIAQGANDYRVVKAESDQMVERIRARGGMVEYVVYPDEGHGMTRRTNQLDWARRTAEFLLERFGLSNLIPEEQPEAALVSADA